MSTMFFCGLRGLRQGDPLTPYLLVIDMKILNKLTFKEMSEVSSKGVR